MNTAKATALANAAGLEVSGDSKFTHDGTTFTVFHVGNHGIVLSSRDGAACYRYTSDCNNFRGLAIFHTVNILLSK